MMPFINVSSHMLQHADADHPVKLPAALRQVAVVHELNLQLPFQPFLPDFLFEFLLFFAPLAFQLVQFLTIFHWLF